MKTRVSLISLLFLLLSNIVFSQAPEYVLPGQTKLLEPKNDTLWILNTTQFKKTIIAKEQLKICNKQVDLYKSMTDSLNLIIKTTNEKAEILQKDRDFYIKKWNEAENDVKLLAELNKKQTTITQIAIIAGLATTIIAFFGGFILAK